MSAWNRLNRNPIRTGRGSPFSSGGAVWTYLNISPSKILYVLDPAVGVNTGAGTWTDAVNGHVFSATTLTTDNSGINGQPRVTFPGSASNTLTYTAGTLSPTKAQAFAVGKSSGSGGSGNGLWEIGGGAGSYVQYTDGNIYEGAFNTPRYVFGNPAGTAASTFVYEITAAGSGSAWTARYNGSQVYTTTGGTTTIATSQRIGAGGLLFTGEIDFIMVLVDNLSGPEETSMRAYITSRWGLTA